MAWAAAALWAISLLLFSALGSAVGAAVLVAVAVTFEESGLLRRRAPLAVLALSSRLLLRIFELAWIYAPIIVSRVIVLALDFMPCSRRSRSPASAKTSQETSPKTSSAAKGRGQVTWSDTWWEETLVKIQKSGPVFVKLCQWVSTRPDLVSEEWCKRLGKLQNETDPHPISITNEILEASFPSSGERGPWYHSFLIEPEPIGSGCMAQVYIGRLEQRQEPRPRPCVEITCKPTLLPIATAVVGLFSARRARVPVANAKVPSPLPSKVAVKVVHPQVRRAMDLDLKFLQAAALIADKLGFQGFGISLALRQFAAFLETQADLRLEAENLRIFRRNFGDGDDAVIVPQVYMPWVSRDVLVMSFEAGEPLSTLLEPRPRDPHANALRQDAFRRLVDSFWAMVFRHRFVHGDLHPGNVLWVRRSQQSVRLVLLDCGLAVDLRGDAGQDLSTAIQTVMATMTGSTEEDEVGRVLIRLAERVGGRPEDVRNGDGFAHGIGDLVREAKVNGFRMGKLNLGSMVARSMLLGRRHRVRFDARFVNLGLAAFVLQGVALKLYPDGEFITRLGPHLFSAAITGVSPI